jgi:uncharacterized membrane protein YfcA
VTQIVEFVVFGLVVGAYGTLVGAGGGFVVVPILLLVYHATPQQAIGTSLAVVFFNALSGTVAYVRQRRVDYATGWRFAVATVPGSIVGSYLSSFFTSRFFNGLFGLLLLAIAVFLNLRPETGPARMAVLGGASLPSGYARRTLVDAAGERYDYAFDMRRGIVLSFVVGFLSSILGIGGGIVHVPAMVVLFGFPAHIATATSHFVLAITALTGSLSHLFLGDILVVPALAMGVGVIAGAQVGAAISRRTKGSAIVRVLSLALVVVGLRLLYGAVVG